MRACVMMSRAGRRRQMAPPLRMPKPPKAWEARNKMIMGAPNRNSHLGQKRKTNWCRPGPSTRPRKQHVELPPRIASEMLFMMVATCAWRPPIRVVRDMTARDPHPLLRRGMLAEFIYTMYKARKAHGDKVILDDVTMSFYPGAKIGIVGSNGAGKSTMLKIMAGLDEASNGEARLTPGYSVGILQQEPPLNEEKTVLGNVEEGLGEIKAKVDRFNEISALMAEPDADFDALMEEIDRKSVV